MSLDRSYLVEHGVWIGITVVADLFLIAGIRTYYKRSHKRVSKTDKSTSHSNDSEKPRVHDSPKATESFNYGTREAPKSDTGNLTDCALTIQPNLDSKSATNINTTTSSLAVPQAVQPPLTPQAKAQARSSHDPAVFPFIMGATICCIVLHNIMLIDPRTVYGILPLDLYRWAMVVYDTLYLCNFYLYQVQLMRFVVRTLGFFQLTNEEIERCNKAKLLTKYTKHLIILTLAWLAVSRAITFDFIRSYKLDILIFLIPGLILASTCFYTLLMMLRSFDLLVRKHIPEEYMNLEDKNSQVIPINSIAAPANNASSLVKKHNIEKLVKLHRRVVFMKKLSIAFIITMPLYGFAHLGVCLVYGERCLVPVRSEYLFTGGYGE